MIVAMPLEKKPDLRSESSADGDTLYNLVNSVLNEFFTPSEVKFGLRVWKAKYSDQELNGLLVLCKELAQNWQLDQHQKHLLRMQLYQRYRDYKAKAEEQPAAVAKAKAVSYRLLEERGFQYRSEQEDQQQEDWQEEWRGELRVQEAALVVFSKVTLRIADEIRQMGFQESKDFILSLKERLHDSGLPKYNQQQLIDWCLHREQVLKVVFEVEDLARLTHMFYIAMCDAIRQAADALFNSVIREAQQLPEAKKFSPEKLC